MNGLALELEVMAAANFDTVAATACHIAGLLGVAVRFTFNDATVWANPGDTAGSVATFYDRAANQRDAALQVRAELALRDRIAVVLHSYLPDPLHSGDAIRRQELIDSLAALTRKDGSA